MPPGQQQRSGTNDNEVIIQWLKDNYEVCTATDDTGALREGVPRASVYERYQKHYSQQRGGSEPLINSATFGKLLRTAFPNVTTRRLGHRGQSKYYYCGIIELHTTPPPPQETPDEMYLDTDNEQFSITSPQQPPVNDKDEALPPFETPAHNYRDDSWQDHAITQLTQMYHQHCKSLLHTVESHQNASEQIIAFYKAMPRTILDLIQTDATIGEELCTWDCILYEAIILAYYPTIDAAVDKSVPRYLAEWSSTLLTILPVVLEGYPEELIEGKMTVTTIFNAKLERIMHLNLLIQATDQVIQENSTRMLNTWQQLNLQQVSDRAQWIIGVKESVIDEQFEHVGSLLKSTDGSNIRHWIEWINTMMNMHIARGQSHSHIKKAAVVWSTYTSLTRREMELLPNADSTILESFEKLWVFSNDYILYLIEQETAKRNIEGLLADDYPNSIYSNNRNRTPDDYVSATTTPNTMMSLV